MPTANLTTVPTLDELAADPSLVANLPPEVARTILYAVSGLIPSLVARAAQQSPQQVAVPATPRRWIGVKQASVRFGVSARWLYAHKHVLPYSQPSHKVLLFDEEKLDRWLAAHKQLP